MVDGKTILVVDDEERVRDSVREILTDEGYRVIEAPDARDVLGLIEKNTPDLVLLDIWMPELDGIGLLKELKEQRPALPVIMISGHGNIQTAVTATKIGAFDFIEKPLSLDALLTAIRRALGEPSARAPIAAADEVNGLAGAKSARGSRSGKGGRPSLRQKTLKKSVVVAGQGLHTGRKTGIILHPLPANSGILFSGISGDTTVPAHLDYVCSTGYATSLQGKGMVVGTVEHFLATLHAYGISNLLVKIEGEIPILDGSALEFCQLIEEAGIEEQASAWSEIVIDRTYRVDAEGGEWIMIEPAESFGARYILHYPKPVGTQEYTYVSHGPQSFKSEIAPARTFGFVREIEKLEKMGLVNGGRLSNCILIDDERIINTDLRYKEELARHKILDIIGDFYLLGRPIRGMITAHMTGHRDNIALLREIRQGMGL
ncbi:MAG TPA: UDP-3-O-acyl-N-acetylglucosamine deacetylase [Candidatus Acidoferrales bacterium]|nr:UDP-3-O-acyl-N-acetylglucosamine deacetylase [Candidatus Acidoferrales bacterium]